MTEYKTLRVPEDAYETAKESKQDSETWGEFLQRCSQNPPERRDFVEADDVLGGLDAGGGQVDTDDLARQVAASIDYAELATLTAGELEGRMR